MPCPRHSFEVAEQLRYCGWPPTEFLRVRLAPIASASSRAVFGPRSHSTFRICTARTGRSAGHPFARANRA